jgi:hypothetical protein
MQAVVELPGFAAAIRGAGLSEGEAQRIIDRIAAEPTAGDLMPGTAVRARSGSPGAARARAAAIG